MQEDQLVKSDDRFPCLYASDGLAAEKIVEKLLKEPEFYYKTDRILQKIMSQK